MTGGLGERVELVALEVVVDQLVQPLSSVEGTNPTVSGRRSVKRMYLSASRRSVRLLTCATRSPGRRIAADSRFLM